MQDESVMEEFPTGPYPNIGGEESWLSTVVANSVDNKIKFETEVLPEMTKQLGEHGWTDKEIDKFSNTMKEKYGKKKFSGRHIQNS